MKEYITTAIIELFTGLVGLNKKQADRRPGQVKEIKGKKGVYEVITPIQLKAGEVITLDPDKVTLAKLDLTEKGLAQETAEKEALIEAEVQRRLAEEKVKAEAEAKKKAAKK